MWRVALVVVWIVGWWAFLGLCVFDVVGPFSWGEWAFMFGTFWVGLLAIVGVTPDPKE